MSACQAGIMIQICKKFGILLRYIIGSCLIIRILQTIAYNLFYWMKRLTLGAKMEKVQADGIRLRLLKVAGKVVRHGRRIWLELCSCFPYRRQLEEALRRTDLLAHGLALLL